MEENATTRDDNTEKLIVTFMKFTLITSVDVKQSFLTLVVCLSYWAPTHTYAFNIYIDTSVYIRFIHLSVRLVLIKNIFKLLILFTITYSFYYFKRSSGVVV